MDENVTNNHASENAGNTTILQENALEKDGSMPSALDSTATSASDAVERPKPNKPKKLLITIAAVAGIVLVALAIIIGINLNYTKPLEKMTATELLDLGEKYLLEMNYEQAIIVFNRLIEIEPMNPRGYTGLAEAYLGLGDVYKAIEVFQNGMNELPDDPNIKEMFDRLIAEQFEIGEQYLRNADYSSAVSHFTRLISIVPLRARGYTGCAEAYVGQGNIEEAIAILRKGLGRLPNEPSILKMLEELLYEQERETLALEATPILTEIAMLCSQKEYETVFAKMQTEDFTKVTELSKFLNRPYIADTEHGKIGVYEVNSERYGNYMIYYGEYSEEIREGSGVWLGYYDGNNYFADCKWKSDVPNGNATVREWNIRLAEDVVYRVIIGQIVNGFWNGDVNWNFECEDETDENTVHFDNGKWIVTKTSTEGDNDHPYRSGDIALSDDDLLVLRGIIGYGEKGAEVER